MRKFLDSVMDYRPDCLHEVVVVNNGSSQSLKDLKDEYGEWVKIVDAGSNLGFGRAQNLAVEHSKGKYILICNPDVEVQEGSLGRMLDYADSIKHFGALGPKLNFPEGGVQQSARRFPTWRNLMMRRLGLHGIFSKKKREHFRKDERYPDAHLVDWLVGAAILMKKDYFEELGGFDDRFFLFLEDTDLCRRVRESGQEVLYYPKVEFMHSKERLSERGFWPFKKVFWIHLASAGKYFWKWRSPAKLGRSKGK